MIEEILENNYYNYNENRVARFNGGKKMLKTFRCDTDINIRVLTEMLHCQVS